MFCNDPGPTWATSPCVEAPGHDTSEVHHRDRDGSTWFISQSTIDEARRIQQRADERSRQDLLRRDLRDKYITVGMPEPVSDRLFEWAWSEGHSAGDHEVEMHYEALKDVVNKAFRAGVETGTIRARDRAMR